MFTVKQLSTLAGVTPRTLHYYDQIDLLKPARVGENGYRYYGEDALLRLQQILLYRELDMPLDRIRQILGRQDFDVQASLEQHRQDLRRRIARMERLVQTVDYTLDHMKGNLKMSKKQLFAGFSDEQQAEYEAEIIHKYDPATVKASSQKWKSYTPAEKQRILDEGSAIYLEMVAAIPEGPDSARAQAGVERWRRHMDYFWTPNLDQLVGLANLYNDDPRFKENFDQIDGRLAEFMRAAVTAYVTARLR
jgi:MerR family transcriptional regulator, thiopeptide resistance regulator